MSLSDVISEDMSVFFSTDEFAETATYVPYDGDMTSVSVILTVGEELEDDMLRVAVQSTGTLMVRESEVPLPTTRDEFEIDETMWMVERVLGKVYGIWKLAIYKDVRVIHRR